MACLDPDRVLDYLARQLGPDERDAVEQHVDTCAPCRELLAEVAKTEEMDELAALDPSRDPAMLGDRYEVGPVIGAGGMGEIRLARDVHIDRDVAVKLLRKSTRSGRLIARFFREARVQGRLEHPAVVPVHDLGIDADGNPYFVMKRLAGTTLAAMLDSRDYDRRRLLGHLVTICRAIELAHSRGVIHRDLKPANIMLGDFGEAYVLDWGLARIVGDVERPREEAAADTSTTQTGAVLGTFGYMPPEQVRGEPLDTAADVFALGCILYEILAGVPALPRGRLAADATLAAREHRPSQRGFAIAPELDDLCAQATAADRTMRPTARELADRVQAYLDGDRDLARRRELADAHAAAAEQAIAHGLDDAARAAAMREAGRALALEPAHARAQAVLARLLLEAPAQLPAGALASSDAERVRMRQQVARHGAYSYFFVAAAIPMFLAFPTHHGWSIVVLAVLNAAAGALALVLSRRSFPVRTPWYLVALALNTVILAAGTAMFGPMLIVPIYIIGSLALWLNLPSGYPAWITVAAHVSAIVPFVLLELAGVLPATMALVDGRMVLTPNVIELTPTSTAIMLGLVFVSQLAVIVYIAIGSRRVHDRTQDRLHAHTWHLEQLLPLGDARATRASLDS